MSREEHLQWAKTRALEYVESGDLVDAVISMASDLQKHEDIRMPPAELIQIGILETRRGTEAVRHWIEGFN